MLLNVTWQIIQGPKSKKEASLSRAYPGWAQHGDAACAVLPVRQQNPWLCGFKGHSTAGPYCTASGCRALCTRAGWVVAVL
jgi:hypothetical protein